MSDTAIITIIDKDGPAPCSIYLHWYGDRAEDFIRQAAHRMNRRDAEYSTARLIGEIHQHIEGNISLGVIAAPSQEELESGDSLLYADRSYVLDCRTGALYMHSFDASTGLRLSPARTDLDPVTITEENSLCRQTTPK